MPESIDLKVIRQALLVNAGGFICALPIEKVREIMRPLNVERLSGLPEYVLGLSLIRGQPTPVVSLPILLKGKHSSETERFVSLNAGHRPVAISVAAVIGVFNLENVTLDNVPPILNQVQQSVASAIGKIDRELLLVLESGYILSEELWGRIKELEQPRE